MRRRLRCPKCVGPVVREPGCYFCPVCSWRSRVTDNVRAAWLQYCADRQLSGLDPDEPQIQTSRYLGNATIERYSRGVPREWRHLLQGKDRADAHEDAEVYLALLEAGLA